MRKFQVFFMCFVLLFLLVISTPTVVVGQGVATANIRPDVEQMMRESDRINVIINLQEPQVVQGEARLVAIDTVQAEVLAELETTGFEMTHQYNNIPAFAGTVDAAGLDVLRRSTNVSVVELDARVRAADVDATQIQAAINEAMAGNVNSFSRPYGLDGSGVTLAVTGGGFDNTHADLAGASIAEICYTRNADDVNSAPTSLLWDCNPPVSYASYDVYSRNIGGTLAASILTSDGNIGPVGVAPSSQLVWMKWIPTGYIGLWSDGLELLDWMIDNQGILGVDVLHFNVYTVSNDGSTNLYTSTCDSAISGLSSMVNQLIGLNIAVFGAAGNDGSSTRISHPGCMSQVIGVGATYSADMGREPDFGTYRFGCFDETTGAEQIVCYTNTNSLVDLIAPGYPITGALPDGRVGWGGGSFLSSAVAAGYGALMKQADPGITPAEIRTALTSTGTLITDDRNGLQFPLIDPQAAIDAVITIPKSITRLEPVDNAFTSAGEQTLQWQEDALAEWYQVYLQGPAGYTFSQWYEETSVCTGSVCSVTLGVLPGGNYTWWMQAWGNNNLGPNTATTFTVDTVTPGEITRINPPMGESYYNLPEPIVFQWQPDPVAEWYHVYIQFEGPDSSDTFYNEWFEASLVCNETICETPEIVNLDRNGYYKWWLAGWGSGNFGPYTETEFRLHLQLPSLPYAEIDPNQGIPTVYFSDDPAATAVEVWIGTGTALFYDVIDKADITCNGDFCLFVPDINPGPGTYYVYMKAYGPGGSSIGGIWEGWNGPFTFDIPYTLPGLVTDLQVTDESTGSPVFSWSGAAYATWYYLWVGTPGPAWETQHTGWYRGLDMGCLNPGLCTLDPDLNLPVGSYVWFVQPVGPGGYGDWGEGTAFTVVP